jgi:hypothetical protein
MYGNALWRAKSHLQANDIAFVPGLNKDLAATAGDDHGCQSSTLAHQSEQVFAAAMMPVLNPATLQDYLDLGLLGFALSRYSGCWVGFKAISETVESSASIVSDPSRVEIVTPDDFIPPPDGLWMRWPDPPLARLHGPKMQAVAAFAGANRLGRVVLDSRAARLGILATGKAYLDLRQALADLGITDRLAEELGLPSTRSRSPGRSKKRARAASPRAQGRSRRRGEARLRRGSACPHSLQHGCIETPDGRRQARRIGRPAPAQRRRADADDRGGRGDLAPAPPRPWGPGARAAAGAPGIARTVGRSEHGQAAAHALFLLRVPTQFVDENP